ncbi:MAG: 5-(carboxyamino)imidazole ribonucleotide mutase [Methanobrevibacter sp.]|jgi:5-(carboxyamino)imidazole ribonucleotide mutase|nr:5-(carboxyamino)imidazole ribonucleotide mutase [Candidatus Methanoflexus mossambicus]
MMAKVMIILGSGSDIKIAEKTTSMLEKLQVPYTINVASAHRTHEKVKNLVEKGTNKGIEVFIAIAGLTAHLGGIIASYTHKPVIGVPVKAKLGGIDAIFANAQMPYPAPVATVGIDRGDNGAILAAQIIAVNDYNIKKNISKLREEYKIKVDKDDDEIQNKIKGSFLVENFMDKEDNDESETSLSNNYKNDITTTNKEYGDALVSVVPGSYSDMKIAKKVTNVLDRLKIPYDLNIISPIRNPDKFEEYINSQENVKVFIAVSGLSAHVAGAIVALSEKPVIGVPCSIELNGLDSLISMTSMPPGVPVATVGISNGKNGGILAGEILAILDKNIESNLKLLKYESNDI